MPIHTSVKEKLSGAIAFLRDDEARATREAARAKVKLQRITDKGERRARQQELRLAEIKRRGELAVAITNLKKAKAGKSDAGTALNKARQTHARSILDWVPRFRRPRVTVSATTKRRASKVGTGAKKGLSYVGSVLWRGTEATKAARATRTTRTTKTRTPTGTSKKPSHYHFAGTQVKRHSHETGHVRHTHKGLRGYGKTRDSLRK